MQSREILMHPINGTACPPLKKERSCNVQGCPIDCKVDEWQSWSDCTSECGGGVQTRTRTKTQEPWNGGLPCPEQGESRSCNTAACNQDCVLNDWNDWSVCSKKCSTGHRLRERTILKEPRGTGECAATNSETRFNFEECNTMSCAEILPPNRSILRCSDMLDVVILLDGSGSLGRYGWQESKEMAYRLVSGMKGGNTSVSISVLLFSGPNRLSRLDRCTGNGGGKPPTPQSCGMYWLSHMSEDIPSVAKAVKNAKWPGRTTLTSLALAEAQAELINGRQGATSVVVVITDGRPLSVLKTGEASDALKKSARIAWVPVGGAIAEYMDNIKHWASGPWEDNIFPVTGFTSLDQPNTINNIIAGFCASVE
jgi:hypothetical protein